jgi:hypothetical protein
LPGLLHLPLVFTFVRIKVLTLERMKAVQIKAMQLLRLRWLLDLCTCLLRVRSLGHV